MWNELVKQISAGFRLPRWNPSTSQRWSSSEVELVSLVLTGNLKLCLQETPRLALWLLAASNELPKILHHWQASAGNPVSLAGLAGLAGQTAINAEDSVD